MLAIAVLGLGRIGRIHAATIAASANARLVAVADPIEAAAKEVAGRTGARISTIDDILAASDVDAVLIATPTDTHADLIERAAKAGKAVFCEKPVDLSSARVRECLATVSKAGTALFVGFNRRFDPHFATLEKRIRTGEIGKVELMQITSRDPSPPPVDYIKRSGGLFRDMMIHDLDMARFLLGEEPVSVQAVASCLVDPAIGAAGDIDTAVVTLKTTSGAICQISNSRRATYGSDQRVEVHGSLGMLQMDNPLPTRVRSASGKGYTGDALMPFFLERYQQAYARELEHFIACLNDGKAPMPNGLDGLKALELADAAEKAARTGETVKL